MRLVEKYRPKTWDDVVNQKEIVNQIKTILTRPNDLPHMLFVGPPGNGKTSVAHLIAKELNCPIIEFNASNDRGIDFVRSEVKEISRLMGKRVLFLDEADNMTRDAQHSMRRIVEKTSTTIFILSGNFEHKFITPIRSRTAVFHFKKIEEKEILRYLIKVCMKEQFKVDFKNKDIQKGFEQLVTDANGDLRYALNSLEKLVGENKEITPANVIGLRQPTMLKTAIQTALAGDFEKAKQIVEDEYIRLNFDSEIIFNDMYHALEEVKEREVKIRLYEKLGELERNIRLGGNPLIQMVAFTAFCWVAPHLPKKFPMEVRT